MKRIYMKNRVLLLILITQLLFACNATGPKFSGVETAQNNQARLYFYRPWQLLDGAAAPTVQINGEDKFDISNGGYQTLSLPPGETTITVKEGGVLSNWRADELTITLPMEASKVYFVRLGAKVENVSGGSFISVSGLYSLSLVAEDFAVNELRETKKN